VRNNGYTVGFYPEQNHTGAQYFSLRFENGDEGVNCLDGSKRSTIVQFDCDTIAPETLPKFINTDENCTSYFTWRTPLGCPVCVDGDYYINEGACDGKYKGRTKIRNSLCNGPAQVALEAVECTNPENYPLAALLVPLLAFIVLAIVAVVMFLRHRKIAKEYHLLLGQGGDRSRPQSVELSSAPGFVIRD
jgi:hypothetical protein